MNGPGSHQHRGLGMQGRYRAVVTGGTPAGPHSRPPAPPHARGGWHPHNQHPQHAQIPQQYTGNKEYPYRQCPPPRFHNGYIIAITNLAHLLVHIRRLCRYNFFFFFFLYFFAFSLHYVLSFAFIKDQSILFFVYFRVSLNNLFFSYTIVRFVNVMSIIHNLFVYDVYTIQNNRKYHDVLSCNQANNYRNELFCSRILLYNPS